MFVLNLVQFNLFFWIVLFWAVVLASDKVSIRPFLNFELNL